MQSQEGAFAQTGMIGTAALLLPEYGSVRSKVGALGPSLKRGDGPRQPRNGFEKSMWPHVPENRVALVPLNVPFAHKRAHRVLVVDEDLSTRTPSASSRPKQQRELKRSSSDPRSLAAAALVDYTNAQRRTQGGGSDELHETSNDDPASIPRIEGVESALADGKKTSNREPLQDGELADTSKRSGFPKASMSSVSWQKCFSKRPRGCPLDGDSGPQESRIGGSALIAAGKATTSPTRSTSLLSLAPTPIPKESLDPSRPRPVELEGSQSISDSYALADADEFSQVSGRPLFKGQIRTFIPPVCTPLAAATLSSPAERHGYDLSPSPPVDRLLQEASSLGSLLSLHDSQAQDFAKMSQTLAIHSSVNIDSADSCSYSKALPSLSKVPSYFLPFITPMGMSLKEPRPRIAVKVPPVRSSSEPFLPKPNLNGRERAAALQVDFAKMRRGANPRLWDKENPRVATEEGLQYSLMDLCICDLEDTPETLKEGLKILRECKEPAVTHGAGRHPTMGVTDRTLLVAERKCKLLSDIVYPLRNSLELNKKMEYWIDTLFDGADPEETVGHCFGLRETLRRGIHQPHGRPQDSDLKSTNFPEFLKTFGLPAEHVSVLEARKQLSATCEEWAEKCSAKAKQAVLKAAAEKEVNPKSPEASAIERLEYFLEQFGVHEDSKWLLELGRCKEAARGGAVMRYAEAEDKYRRTPGGKDPVFRAADRIEKEIEEALEFGVEADQPDLKKAITIGHHVRGEAIYRYALEVAKSSGTRLGDAEAAALKIEAYTQEAMKVKGLPPDIEELARAAKVVLGLREDEGKRKREANSKKRAEDQAKKAAKA